MTRIEAANASAKARSRAAMYGQSLLDRVTQPSQSPKVNLLRAGRPMLERYGIPPRPDPMRQSEAFRVWSYFFGGGAIFAETGIELSKTNFQFNGTGANSTQSHFESSSNWSGAYVIPTDGEMALVIMGRWIVPTPALPPPEEQAPGIDGQYACSTWIGLDGQRLYFNSSLPQIGTAQTLTVSASGPPLVEAFAWFQWWASEECRPYIRFPLPVMPGDEVACLLWVISDVAVVATVLNLSTGQLIPPITATAWQEPLPGGTLRQLVISGATAEWIMERPTFLCTSQPYWFPDYGSTEFLDCVAIMGPAPGMPQTVKDLRVARLIRMYDTLYPPTRIRYISMPEKKEPSNKKFRVRYGDF
jgi:hypothetical protein